MTDELVYQIDLAWDKMGFKNLDASIAKTVKAFAVATAAVTAASAAIFSMSKNYAETTDDLIKTAERVNATTESLERLSFAAEDNGSSMDDVSSSLGALAKAQEELLRGKGDFEAWGQLGVNPTQYEDTASLLLGISDQVKNMDSVKAQDLLTRVGISPSMLQTMQLGSDGIDALGDKLEALGGISTERMKKSSQDFMSGWHDASKTVDGMLDKVSATMLEGTINPAIKAFNKFASKNMKQIGETITSIFDAISKASTFIFGLVARISQPFIKLNDLLGGVENTIKALGAVMLFLGRNTIIAMAPAIIAVGALFLAFDDLMSFLSGQDSVLGDFINNFPILSKVAGAAAVALGAIGIALSANPIGLAIKAFAALSAGLVYFTTQTETGKEMFASLMQWVDDAIKMFENLGKTISKALDFELPSIPSLGDVGEGVANVAGGLFDSVKGSLGFGATPTAQAVAQTTQNNNNIQISVDGSKNPEETARVVKKVLNEEMNKSASRIGY